MWKFNDVTSEEVKIICEREFADKPDCHSLINCIVHLRREEDVDLHKKEFFELLDNIDSFIDQLSSRWLVSVTDTVADYGSPIERANAILISSVFVITTLGDSYIDIVNDNTIDESKVAPFKYYELWDGFIAVNMQCADTATNLFRRVRKSLQETPSLLKIWDTLVERLLDDDNKNFMKTLNDLHCRGFF